MTTTARTLSPTLTTPSRPPAAWQRAWREGLAPCLPTAGLAALERALRENDPRLVPGLVTSPPPLLSNEAEPVCAACAVGLALWLGEGLLTVGQVEEQFHRVCFEADQRLGEPAAIRHFFGWFDEADRAAMRPALLAEVRRELARRRQAAA